MAKLLNSAFAVLAFGAATTAFAQAPPPVVDTPQEAANKKVVAGWADLLSQGKVKQAFELYVSKSFDDHSDMAAAMLDGKKLSYSSVEGFLAKDFANGVPGAKPGAPAVAQVLVADKDMVTEYGAIGVDIYRVKNGKIVEHWDASPPQSAVSLTF